MSRAGVEPTKPEVADLQSACFSHLHTSTFRERKNFHLPPHDYQSCALLYWATFPRSVAPLIQIHLLQRMDSNHRSLGYEPSELTSFSTLRFRGHHTPLGGLPRSLLTIIINFSLNHHHGFWTITTFNIWKNVVGARERTPRTLQCPTPPPPPHGFSVKH